jgi:hypothetical protein
MQIVSCGEDQVRCMLLGLSLKADHALCRGSVFGIFLMGLIHLLLNCSSRNMRYPVFWKASPVEPVDCLLTDLFVLPKVVRVHSAA